MTEDLFGIRKHLREFRKEFKPHPYIGKMDALYVKRMEKAYLMIEAGIMGEEATVKTGLGGPQTLSLSPWALKRTHAELLKAVAEISQVEPKDVSWLYNKIKERRRRSLR